jgi:REP element-mobilizing transposase RayT
MNDYHQPLFPDNIYHLFSRAVGMEKLFLSHENYLFFLQKLKQHTSGICQLYCYSLIPNHFHLLAKIKDEQSIINHFEETKKKPFEPLQHDLSDFIMERFSNFLNSYTKAFNKVNKRKGALFMDYLKRSMMNDSVDFTSYVWYGHKNAVHHQLTNSIGEWPYDSYRSLISDAPTSLLREEVIECFG